LLQVFIVVGSVVIAVAVAVWIYPPLFPWGLAQMDRSPYCPREEAYRASERRYELIQAIGTVQEGLRLLDSDSSGYELWQTGNGPFWTPAGGVGPLTVRVAEERVDLYGGGAFSINEGDVVLDYGAGVGTYVREALGAGAEKIVAIEVDPAHRECLRRNFKDAIDKGAVVIYPGVVEGEQAQVLNANLYPVVLENERGPDGTIPFSKIDLLVLELNLDRVDAIRVASRGMSLRVLNSGSDTIRKHGPRLAVSTEEPEDDEVKVTEWLARFHLGYESLCSVCGINGDLMVKPDVVLFRTPSAPAPAIASTD
jgi:FkbM family methyltransferase